MIPCVWDVCLCVSPILCKAAVFICFVCELNSELFRFCVFNKKIRERTCLFLRISLCILERPLLHMCVRVCVFSAAVCVKL